MTRELINVPDWINIVDSNVPAGTEYWHLKRVEYWDSIQSGGTHHIYADKPHDPALRMEVSNGKQTWFVTLDKPSNEPAGNFPMWSDNRYSAKMEGASDRIEGMHIPQKQHVSFLLIWERRIKDGTQGDSLENILLRKAEEISFDLNQEAALFKEMWHAGFVPCSPEFTAVYSGETYVGQAGKKLDTSEECVFFVLSEDWANVRSIKKKQHPLQTPTPPPSSPPVIEFIQTQGSRFVVNNRPFRFVGANIRGLIHYGHGAPLQYSRREHVDIQLQGARQMGARVVRVFGANRHASVKQIGDRLEQALKRVEDHGMHLIFAFTDVHHDTGFNVPGDERFYQDNRLDKAWYEGGYRENYLPFVEQIVKRFKDHKRICLGIRQ
jgi:hypothetical protein